MSTLKDKIDRLPDSPGVYLFKDEAGTVIYVGKAKSLRDRVKSYFLAGGGHSLRTEQMIDDIVDVETIGTDSEVDALLVEARLIKDIQPRNNVRVRDDKSYPYIEITMQEEFPRIGITRKPQKKSRLFGPFVDIRGLRAALKILQKIFKFRVCHLDISSDDEKRQYHRPCLYHFIDSCTAPCADRVSKDEYRRQVRHLISFLGGKGKSLIKKLERLMMSASRSMHYEEAARYRDQIKAIKALSQRGLDTQMVIMDGLSVDPLEGLQELEQMFGLDGTPRIVEGVDIAHLQGSETVGSLVQFIDGMPFKNGYRRFRIRTVEGVDDFASMREVVRRRYRRLVEEEQLLPDILLLDGGPGQLSAAEGVLEELGVELPLVISLAKREETIIHKGKPIVLDRTSPALKLLQYVRDEAHRFAQGYHHLLRSKKVLGDGFRKKKKR